MRLENVTKLDCFRRTQTFTNLNAKSLRETRCNIGRSGNFLKGPISWKWLSVAGKISPRALQLGIVLWFLEGLNKGITFRYEHKRGQEIGLNRGKYYRARNELVRAGLITIESATGRSDRITLIKE